MARGFDSLPTHQGLDMSTFLAIMIGLAIGNTISCFLGWAAKEDAVLALYNQVIGAGLFMVAYQATHQIWL